MEMVDTLTADTADWAKLESLRAARLADADARSRQVVNALAAVAEVLTAEQRTTLKKRLEDFRAMAPEASTPIQARPSAPSFSI